VRKEQSAKPAFYVAAIILTFFGTYLLVRWCASSFDSATPLRIILGVIAAALIGFSLLGIIRNRAAPSPDDSTARTRKRRAYAFITGAEALGIYVLTNVLTTRGHAEWINAALILIVGLHFLPLARVFKHRAYLATGAALIAIAIVLPQFATGGAGSPLLLLFSGLVLWLTAAHCLWLNRNLNAVAAN
jgi:hypothetical protein